MIRTYYFPRFVTVFAVGADNHARNVAAIRLQDLVSQRNLVEETLIAEACRRVQIGRWHHIVDHLKKLLDSMKGVLASNDKVRDEIEPGFVVCFLPEPSLRGFGIVVVLRSGQPDRG
jgi:hypothetical protein